MVFWHINRVLLHRAFSEKRLPGCSFPCMLKLHEAGGLAACNTQTASPFGCLTKLILILCLIFWVTSLPERTVFFAAVCIYAVPVFQSMKSFSVFLTGHVYRRLYPASAFLFCRKYKPKKQSAEKAMPQRMYIQLKNSRLTAYRMGIRVKSTAYGSALPIASMTAVTRNGLTPHRYAPRKYSASFSTTVGSSSPST